MKRVPPPIMVLSILGIIFSLFGFCADSWVIFNTFVPFGPPNPAMDAVRNDNLYLVWTLAATVVSLLLAFLLLASSIGSLRLYRWARFGMMAYAVLSLLVMLVNGVFTAAYVLPRMSEAVTETNPDTKTIILATTISSLLLGFLLALVWAVLVFIFFNRKSAVDAFHGIFPPEVPPEPVPVGPPF